MTYFKAKFIKGLPRANVKNVSGNPISCLMNTDKSQAKVFCRKGECVLVTVDAEVKSLMRHWRVYFYDGRVLRMAEAACVFYLKTERKGKGVLTNNVMGLKLAERFESALSYGCLV